MRIEVDGLSCRAGRRVVLSDVSATIEDGEVVGVVGPNGSGKSTLLATLAGHRRPVAGTVRVGGRDLRRLSPRHRARLIATMGQNSPIPDELSVVEVVALGRTPYLPPWGAGSTGERDVVERVLRTVDLDGFADRPVARLSGGEQRRVLLARALAQDSPVLLLDEPTNHLDVAHRLHLMSLVRGLGRTVVMAVHDLGLARSVCDRVLVLDGGTARPLAPPILALDPTVIADVFGVDAVPVTHPVTGETHLLFTPLRGDRPTGPT